MPGVGVQSEIDVNTSPTVPSATMTQPHVWSWIWFAVAVFVIIGFHIRVFGHAVPPTAHFP